jgi:hypothetical protein
VKDCPGLFKVTRLAPLHAVRFDGTREHAQAIIGWIRDWHDGEVAVGHFQSGTLYQPLRSGEVMSAQQGWWIVQIMRLKFVAYHPDVFPQVFEVMP